ncbi:trans-sialidase [Trypanosoma theileri]|uniref:Trans-sialidase n=1 Tax=Trypanosoma theileri TaxID=67003 RepID=A0A1X0NMG2_9TRYP|nr:trans-sialidase [Trypanosoma theileri]ORC85906.1 trans-sialidase [Trypanosoma theileri]
MPHSLFVVLLLLLLGCISGYAQESHSQRSADDDGVPSDEPTEKMMPGHDELQQLHERLKELRKKEEEEQQKKLKELEERQSRQQAEQRELTSSTVPSEISFRRFNGVHVVEFVNGELVAIDAAGVEQSLKDNSEFVEFLSQDMNNNGEWTEIHLKWFGPKTDKYGKNLEKYKPHGDPRAVVALVERNIPPIEAGSVLRLVWVTTLNNGTEKYSLSYTPFNVKFPFTEGTTTVLGFLGNEITPILTMKNGTFVFPVQLVTTENRFISTVMYYTSHDKQWNIAGLADEGNTYNPAILEWKEGNLMMIAQHNSGFHRVYQSSDLGKTWKESTSTFSRVWASTPVYPGRGSQNNFMTATIDGKDVILFAQSLDSEGIERHLWLTDNTRIYHVGVINKDKEGIPCTLLFKDHKLYCLYEAGIENDENRDFSVELTTAMEDIKRVLTTWTEQDKTLSGKACTSGQCKYPVSTIGLVGYLSGKSDGGEWNDEYLCVNAVVSGTTEKVSNGLNFNGAGAGAVWPLSDGRLARQYHFANYAFTLAATVTIHAVPEEDSRPLLGARLWGAERMIFLGVSYNKDKTWSTVKNDNEGKAEIPKWEVDNEYSVILTFENGKGSVYINGTRLDVGTDLRIAQEGEVISHFYFGAYSREDEEVKANVHITVKDVMLYNRGLLPTEIDALIKNKANVLLSESEIKRISEQVTASHQNSATSTTAGAEPTKDTGNTNSGGQANSQITVELAKAHQNTIDGTVRVYGYGLPILLLGLWALATILL